MAAKGKLTRNEMKLWLNKMDTILDSNFLFQGDGPNMIIPDFLFLGDAEDAENIKQLEQYGISLREKKTNISLHFFL